MFLLPRLDKKLREPLYIQLYKYIVGEIQIGRLKQKDRLPSIRTLSKDLAVSRTTVENGYNQLMVEGYIISSIKKGYYVSETEWTGIRRQVQEEEKEPIESNGCYDFKRDYVSKENFDYKLWKKYINQVLNEVPKDLYSYGHVRGTWQLREAITQYFYQSRGLITSPKRLVIGGGVGPLLAILMDLFKLKGVKSIGIENPGFGQAREIFRHHGMKVVPISVGKQGMNIDQLALSDVMSCYVSPSHQFPIGGSMPIKERQKLLNWAEKVEGYIIEDDYNLELRFEGRPIPAMQGLDTYERVIYLGSFSTVLAPAIRISFMTLPESLNHLFELNQKRYTQTASKLEQLTLAKLMNEGDFEKHIRKIRKNYARKQRKITDYIKKYFPKLTQFTTHASGLQIILEMDQSIKIESVLENCQKADVVIERLSNYYVKGTKVKQTALVLNYRGIEEIHLEEGIRRLGLCIQSN